MCKRLCLAEESQEKEILRQKTKAVTREDEKFLEIEMEYETDSQSVKEDEEELSLVKELMRKKK